MLAGAIKLLNAVIAPIRHVHIAATIYRKCAIGLDKFSIRTTIAAPHGQPLSIAGKFLNAMVANLRNVHISPLIDGNPGRTVELAWLVAEGSPLAQKLTIAVVHLDTRIASIGNID